MNLFYYPNSSDPTQPGSAGHFPVLSVIRGSYHYQHVMEEVQFIVPRGYDPPRFRSEDAIKAGNYPIVPTGNFFVGAVQDEARQVMAVEPSTAMRELQIRAPRIRWIRCRMEEVSFQSKTVDVVLSVRSLQYVERAGEVMEHVFGWLRPGNSPVFSVEHPLRHAP